MKKSNDKDIQVVKEAVKFMSWSQEFTKKIVSIYFFIFVISNILFLGVASVAFFQTGGEMMYFNTFVTEVHTTFRDVIGGYIIKAAMENVLKIGGSYIERIFEVKYNLGISDDSSSTEIAEEDALG